MPDNKSFWVSGVNGGTGPPDINVHLAFQCDRYTCIYTVVDWNDTVWTYARAERFAGQTALRLTSIKYRNGYTQTLQYAPCSGSCNNALIASVTDSFGRTLTFGNDGGHITSVTTPEGLTITYSFPYPPGILASVTYPTSPSSTQTYLYEDTNFYDALTGMVDENGNRFATWTYDDSSGATSGFALSRENRRRQSNNGSV
jgi:hypothetical protein